MQVFFLLTFASRNQIVGFILLKGGEADVRDRPGVTVTCQRNILSRRVRSGLRILGSLGLRSHRKERESISRGNARRGKARLKNIVVLRGCR